MALKPQKGLQGENQGDPISYAHLCKSSKFPKSLALKMKILKCAI